MNNFKCVIIDDEDHAIATLTDYVIQHTELELIKSYNDPVTALAEIKQGDRLDIVFLDVDMPDISGIELAQRLKNKVGIIIFTTAYTEYVWNAFDIPVEHFMVKPIKQTTFVTTLQTVIDRFLYKSLYREEGVIYIKTPDKLRIIKTYINDISVIEGARNYIEISTPLKKFRTKMSMWQAENILKGTKLIRVHRSWMINMDKVIQVIGNSIKLQDNGLVPIGNEYKEMFSEYFGEKTMKPGRDLH